MSVAASHSIPVTEALPVADGTAACDALPLCGVDPEELDAVRGRVLFIGGGTCAGKTTLARRLSQARGVPLFSSDDYLDRYAQLAERAGSAVAHHVAETDFDRF